jgi:DNA modification methylase
VTGIILVGDARSRLRELPDGYAQTCVTSPPYFGLRDYGVDGQMGLEQTPNEYVAGMVELFREVRRVLRDDGTLWLNLGDSYAGYHGNKNASMPTSATNGWTNGTNENSRGDKRPQDIGLKPKDLIGIPWRVAFALQADGWYLRQDIIWHKPNPMPESVRDRCTKAHEYIFLLSKSPRYYFDNEAIKEPAVRAGQKAGGQGRKDHEFGKAHGDVHRGSLSGNVADTRNRRSVWTVPTRPFKGAHFATFPPDLIEPCILAGAPVGGMVIDPFGGAGTTALVSDKLGRESTLIELNPEYAALASERTGAVVVPEGL